MDNKHHQEIVKAAIKPSIRNKRMVVSKRIPRYPASAEREMRRVNAAYMKLLKRRLNQHMQEILGVCKEESRTDSRMDSFMDLKARLSQIFMRIAAELEQDIEKYGLIGRLTDIAYNAKGTAYMEERDGQGPRTFLFSKCWNRSCCFTHIYGVE